MIEEGPIAQTKLEVFFGHQVPVQVCVEVPAMSWLHRGGWCEGCRSGLTPVGELFLP